MAAGTENNYAFAQDTELSDDPVDLWADQVEYNENSGIVTATGNVELVQVGRTLRADSMSYDLNKDNVVAQGNVVLEETTGDIYRAEHVTLKDQMKDGFVRGLEGVLADGSRFSAQEAQKVADLKVIMRKASYTACEICQSNPDKPPIWQIKARNVTHHKDEARISYDDATFEVAGVPIGYLPYFSHSDGSLDRKSGLLFPSIGFGSRLGTSYAQEFYYDISPNQDATIGVAAFSREAPLVIGEYRHRFKDAEIQFNGGATYSSRVDLINDTDVVVDEEARGHLFVEGLWNINDKWRAGGELQIVSDDQYARQYGISNEDILENTIYAERFLGRDYVNARLINFQDVRVSDRSDDQPNVLPELYTRFLGKPNATLGGRWDFETSLLGLQREGSGQDVGRASAKVGWQRRHESSVGLVSNLDLTLRGDAYRVNNRDVAIAQNGLGDDSTALRSFGQAHLQTSYPLAKNLKKATLVVEPMASLTIGTNLEADDEDIPNEDSQDVVIGATNLFNANRFPGYDRIEDERFTTYGVRTGIYGDQGYQGEVFFGQSYRLESGSNPFPEGSGLSEQNSDFVGNVSISAGHKFNLNYGLQLDSDQLSSQRHEVDATGIIGDLTLNARYFYANALQGTDFSESREQIRARGRYQLTDKWSVLGGAQYDLARETEGLRSATYGLDYQGQCVNFLVSGTRNLTLDSSGDSGTEIMMRLGLKNLGEFETSGFSLGAGSSDTGGEN